MNNYSQNTEQETILSYFDKHGVIDGKFIEIGAYDPFVFSNTRALVERGWSGVYIEPVKKHVDRFREVYLNDERIQIINAALSYEPHEVVTFWECDDAVSTTDINHKHKWEKSGVPFKEVTVPVLHVEQMQQIAHGYDFMTLDTEATSYTLFGWMSDDFLSSLKLICIEHDNHYKEIQARLHKFGFSTLLFNGENIILGR